MFDLHVRPADASSPASVLVTGAYDNYPASFAPDGHSLIFTRRTLPNARAMSVPLGGGVADTVFAPAFPVTDVTLSPDGRWLAYTATESGRPEVFVSSYPDPSLSRQQVSSEGGAKPLWTRGGGEIVFRSWDQVIAVTVDPTSGDLGRPEVLFEGPYLYPPGNTALGYDVSADGERFLFVKRPLERAPRRLIVVTNFFEELKRIVPN